MAKTPSKKSAKAQKKTGKGSHKKARVESYGSYIYKVLKQVHPDTGISKKGMAIINSFVGDVFEKVAVEGGKVTRAVAKQATLSARDIQTAVRLTLPRGLAKHAVSEGTKAVTKYTSAQPVAAKKGEKPPPKRKVQGKYPSRSTEAGITFPVGRTQRYLKKHANTERVSVKAAVFLAGVLEYLAAEVLELAGNAARDNKKTRIIPRHIQLAVRSDDELSKLISATIPGAGVIPSIHTALVPKAKKPKGTKFLDSPSKGGFYSDFRVNAKGMLERV